MDHPQETPYAHYDQPAFEHMRIDHSISRVAIFFICFLTIGVFYFSLVSFPIAKMLPLQQIQQLTQLGSILGGSSATTGGTSTLDSSKPSGAALGGQSASASESPASSGSASPAASSQASTSPAASAASRPASPAASPSNSGAANDGSYTVQSGDSLTAIARKYNTTVQALAAANKISETGALKVGQRLTIPS